MPKIYGYTEILGDILVTGSFSVLGSASVINTTNLVVSDTIISLGHSQSGSPVLDEGIMFGRGTGLTQALIWDESDDTFALISTNDDHTVVGDVSILGYSNLRLGGLTTSNLTITSGAQSGYILQSDATGNATWVAATSASANFANTNLTFTGNREHNTNGGSFQITTDNGGFAAGFIYFNNTQKSEYGFGTSYTDWRTLSVDHYLSGVKRLELLSTETVFNNPGGNYDFRIEGVSDQNLFFVDASTDRIGIGTSTPQYKFEVSSPTGSFQVNEASFGLDVNINGTSPGVPQFRIIIPSYLTNPSAGGSIGMRTWDDSSFPGYGKIGDMFIYADNAANGLNFINTNGTGTEDYIRFYAGRQATFDPDLHIHGTGTTRGFVGIGVTGPNYKLEVSGTVSTTGIRMTSGANSGYVLTSDATGNATWQSLPSGVSIYSTTQAFTSGVTYSINHALNTNNILVNVWNDATGELIVMNVTRTSVNAVDVNSSVSISSGRIVIMGG